MPQAIDLLFQVNLEFLSFNYFHQKPHFIALLLEVKLEVSVSLLFSSKAKHDSLTFRDKLGKVCFFSTFIENQRL